MNINLQNLLNEATKEYYVLRIIPIIEDPLNTYDYVVAKTKEELTQFIPQMEVVMNKNRPVWKEHAIKKIKVVGNEGYEKQGLYYVNSYNEKKDLAETFLWYLREENMQDMEKNEDGDIILQDFQCTMNAISILKFYPHGLINNE